MYTTETKVSYLNPPETNTKPTKSLTIVEVYRTILEDPDLQRITRELRKIPETDEEGRKSFKKKSFPSVLFGGTFRHRSIKGLEKPSNLLIVDLDDLGTLKEVEKLKETLSQDKTLDPVLLFVSPSGNGLKVVVNIGQEIKGDEDFKRSFKAVKNYLSKTYSLEVDESGKDISRGCFLPYDKNAICQEPGSGFNVEKYLPVEKPKPQPQRIPVSSYNEPDDYTRAKIAVEDIENSGIDITPTYDLWTRVGFALSNLGEPGRDLFHRVSSLYDRYTREETDKQFDSFLRSNGSGVNLESLFAIARERGVKLRSSNVYSQKLNYLSPIKKGTNQPVGGPKQEPEPDEDRSFLLRPTTEAEMFERESKLPEGLRTGYTIGEGDDKSQIILGSGVLTGIVGATGHRKTVLLLNMILNVAKIYPDKKFVYFTYEQNGDQIREYLLNVYLEDLDLKFGQSNRRLLKRYFHSRGNTSMFEQEEKTIYERGVKKKVRIPDEFRKRKGSFFRNFIENGRILINYVDSDSSRLVKDIEYLSTQDNLGGIFVDYFQCINVPEDQRLRLTRVEELKRICFYLKDVANETGLPVVLACQFNQEVGSPFDVLITKVGEAGDISRIMSEMFGIWSLDKEITKELKGDQNQKNEALKNKVKELQSDRLEQGRQIVGLYVKTLKSRELPTGTEVVLPVFGKTGRVFPNDPTEAVFDRRDWETDSQEVIDFPE